MRKEEKIKPFKAGIMAGEFLAETNQHSNIVVLLDYSYTFQPNYFILPSTTYKNHCETYIILILLSLLSKFYLNSEILLLHCFLPNY